LNDETVNCGDEENVDDSENGSELMEMNGRGEKMMKTMRTVK